MEIAFWIICCVIGLTAVGLIYLLSTKVKNKLWACALSCILGFAIAIGLTILFFYLMPEQRTIVHDTIKAVQLVIQRV